MSKKTNAAKLKAKATKPRRRAHRPKGKRPNPALVHRDNRPVGSILLGDPIFLHHLAMGILRYLELCHPVEAQIAGMMRHDLDAEFIAPERLTGTDSSESPDSKKDPEGE